MQLERGIICASAGNHAQGVSLAAKKLGTKATIVMPKTTPEVKVEAVKKLGAFIILVGDSAIYYFSNFINPWLYYLRISF